MSQNFHGTIKECVASLRRDLVEENAQISTIRNYRFAILPYDPEKEFELRREVVKLTTELENRGWAIETISLHALLMTRLQATGPDTLTALAAREKRLFAKDPARALSHLREQIAPHIEGPQGIAADVSAAVDAIAQKHASNLDRVLVLVARAGALYPFFRSSALLKHLDGRTNNLPVVLLYPGRRSDQTALSFMGELPPDRDYRPRIYP